MHELKSVFCVFFFLGDERKGGGEGGLVSDIVIATNVRPLFSIDMFVGEEKG